MKYSTIDYTKDIKVLGKVVSISTDNTVAEAEQVFDSGFSYNQYQNGLDQHTINTLFRDMIIGFTNAGFTPNNNNKLNLNIDNLHVYQNATIDGVLLVDGVNVKDQLNYLLGQIQTLNNRVTTLEQCCQQVNQYINGGHGGQDVFTLDPIGLSLIAGGNTATITAKINGIATGAVTWQSSNSAVASVVNGVVTSGIAGTATITATHTESQLTATCIVTVTEPQRTWELVIVGDNRTLLYDQTTHQGESTTLQAVIQEVGNSHNTKVETITWSSSPTSGIVRVTSPGATTTVTATGVASGASTGEAVITARSASGLIASVGISTYTQVEEPTSITVNGYPSMYLGDTQQLQAVVMPVVASNSVEWSSSNPSITVVNGLVTASATGTVTITATSTVKPSVSGSITIDIIDPAQLAVSNISISDMTVNVGESLDIKQYTTMTQANSQPNIEYQKWTYSVTPLGYATVDSTGWITGVATTDGLSGGYATVRVTYHDDVNGTTPYGEGKVYVVTSGGDVPSTPEPNVSESLTLTVLNEGDIHVGDVVSVQVTSTPGIQSVYNSINAQYTGSNAGTPWWRLYMNGNTSGVLTYTGYVDTYHNYPNYTSVDIYCTDPVYYYRQDGYGNYTTTSESGIDIGRNIVNYPLSNADLNVPNSIIVKFVATDAGTITLTGKTMYTAYNFEGASGTCNVVVHQSITPVSSVTMNLDSYSTRAYSISDPYATTNVNLSVHSQDLPSGNNAMLGLIVYPDGSIQIPRNGKIQLSVDVSPSGSNQNVVWTKNGGSLTSPAVLELDGTVTVTNNTTQNGGYGISALDPIVIAVTSAEDSTKTDSIKLRFQEPDPAIWTSAYPNVNGITYEVRYVVEGSGTAPSIREDASQSSQYSDGDCIVVNRNSPYQVYVKGNGSNGVIGIDVTAYSGSDADAQATTLPELSITKSVTYVTSSDNDHLIEIGQISSQDSKVVVVVTITTASSQEGTLAVSLADAHAKWENDSHRWFSFAQSGSTRAIYNVTYDGTLSTSFAADDGYEITSVDYDWYFDDPSGTPTFNSRTATITDGDTNQSVSKQVVDITVPGVRSNGTIMVRTQAIQ